MENVYFTSSRGKNLTFDQFVVWNLCMLEHHFTHAHTQTIHPEIEREEESERERKHICANFDSNKSTGYEGLLAISHREAQFQHLFQFHSKVIFPKHVYSEQLAHRHTLIEIEYVVVQWFNCELECFAA